MESTVELQEQLGFTDLFALRRIGDEHLVNLGGVGRGEGWAGNISIDAGREPFIAEALGAHGLVRYRGPLSRIFGPYWSEEAAAVEVGDFVVVIGGPGTSEQDDETLIGAAGDFAWSVGDVSAEKRLADELELTQAALSIASLPVATIDQFLADLADAAVAALSCEFGAVVIRTPTHRLVLAPKGITPAADQQLVLGALLQLLATLTPSGPVVAQDLRNDRRSNSPLGFQEGLVSRCVIPLNVSGVSGAIVVAHTMSNAPRGFTSQCQQVAAAIGEQASRVLSNSFDTSALSAPAKP